jgi:hypothetical protein
VCSLKLPVGVSVLPNSCISSMLTCSLFVDNAVETSVDSRKLNREDHRLSLNFPATGRTE